MIISSLLKYIYHSCYKVPAENTLQSEKQEDKSGDSLGHSAEGNTELFCSSHLYIHNFWLYTHNWALNNHLKTDIKW